MIHASVAPYVAFFALALAASATDALQCVSGGGTTACLSSLTGDLMRIGADNGAMHMLGTGSGTYIAGCSSEVGSAPRVNRTGSSYVAVTRSVKCKPSFWNPRGGQMATITDFLEAVDGAIRWRAEVTSSDAQAWTTAVQSVIHWDDFNNARLWVGGPSDDEPAAPGKDPLAPFEPKAGRLNYAYGGRQMFADYPTPEADWTAGQWSGIPLALVSRISKDDDVAISWAQDARDAPPVAQLVALRDALAGPSTGPAPGPAPHPAHNATWFVATDYNAVYGARHDVPGKFHLHGAAKNWIGCEAACASNSSCFIYAWSGASNMCWWRLDGQWGAATTLTKEAGRISGCFNGFTKDGAKVVPGCGHNPIPGHHPEPPTPPAPPSPVQPGGPHLTLNFSRQYIRLGSGTAPSVWTQYLYSHVADWRPAVDFMVKRWPKHFLTNPSINLSAVAGPCSYADYRGGMSEDTAATYRRMGYTLNWDASFPYPYHGLWLPYAPDYGPKWVTCFGHDPPDSHASGACRKTSYEEIRTYYESMTRHGFRTCAYGNIFEYGSHIVEPSVFARERCAQPFDDPTIAVDSFCANIASQLPTCREIHCKSQSVLEQRFAKSVLRRKDKAMVYGGMGGAVVMDPGTKEYQEHLLNVSRTIMQKTPATGLCIDRQDWVGFLNFERDDGLTWYEGAGSHPGGQPAAAMVYSWKQAMARLMGLWHSQPDQPLLVNTLTYRLDMMEFADGIFSEYGDAPHQQFIGGLLGLARPSMMWNHPGQSNVDPDKIDHFLQNHIHFGVWPALPIKDNDHVIGPGKWDKVFELYGPLFTAYRGRVLVLEPHALQAVHGSILANAFDTPQGTVVTLTFGPQGPQSMAQVRIKIAAVHAHRSWETAVALRPDAQGWVSVKCALQYTNAETVDCAVPLARGCAILLLPRSRGEAFVWI